MKPRNPAGERRRAGPGEREGRESVKQKEREKRRGIKWNKAGKINKVTGEKIHEEIRNNKDGEINQVNKSLLHKTAGRAKHQRNDMKEKD